MKTILCFGDSNTWGYRPDGAGRFDWEVRWPGILQKELSGFARVIEEGLNARTTVFPRYSMIRWKEYPFAGTAHVIYPFCWRRIDRWIWLLFFWE